MNDSVLDALAQKVFRWMGIKDCGCKRRKAALVALWHRIVAPGLQKAMLECQQGREDLATTLGQERETIRTLKELLSRFDSRFVEKA